MTGAGPQLAVSSGHGTGEGRSPMAHLLHALNQPLTGLQCSMELALAGPRPATHYVRTLSEGLELVSRMRVLVEALRELADLQSPAAGPSAKQRSVVLLDHVLWEAARELEPVAESKEVRIVITNASPLPIRADLAPFTTLVFRTMECALSLAGERSEIRIEARNAHNTVVLTLSWTAGDLPEHSPFSRPELGLLIARGGWEHLGTCTEARGASGPVWTIRIPAAWATQPDEDSLEGDGK